MQNGHFIVNFHEHPGESVAENNAKMGIDMAVLLPVGTDAMSRAVEMAREKPDEFVPFYWVDNTQDLADEPRRLRQAVKDGLCAESSSSRWISIRLRTIAEFTLFMRSAPNWVSFARGIPVWST